MRWSNDRKIYLSKPILIGWNRKRDFSVKKWTHKRRGGWEIIINGGISKIDEIKNHLTSCDGVMIGRSIYQNPYSLVEIENEIFGTKEQPTREEIAAKLLEYLEKEVKLGTKVNHIMRHTVGLYHGQIGSKDWKRYLSDNMMARDSDFQKSKHIMTIVQNNEKANQVNS